MPPTPQQALALRAISAAFREDSDETISPKQRLIRWCEARDAIENAASQLSSSNAESAPAEQKLNSYRAHIEARVQFYTAAVGPIQRQPSTTAPTRIIKADQTVPLQVVSAPSTSTPDGNDYLLGALTGFDPLAKTGVSTKEDSKEAEYLELLASLARAKKIKAQQQSQPESSPVASVSSSRAAGVQQHVDPLECIDKRLNGASPLPPGPKKAASGTTTSPPPPPPMTAAQKTGVPRASAKRDQEFTLSSAGASYAPRTSEIVLKGMEVAAKLMGTKNRSKTKQAVDILQHVYYEGRLETHNTASFEATMKEAVLDARRKYYKDFPPRLLQDNPVDPVEMALLRSSGQTSTILLPIWDDVIDGYASENVYFPLTNREKRTAEELLKKQQSGDISGLSALDRRLLAPGWVDPSSPTLAPKQKVAGAKWMRAPQIFAAMAAASPPTTNVEAAPPSATTEPASDGTSDSATTPTTSGVGSQVALISSCDPLKIKQTIVGDCSLVCSLIVCADFQKRFPKAKIISNAIYPQEEAAASGGDAGAHPPMLPILNAEGKYCVKMLVNGITRMVVVDDRIPVASEDGRPPRFLCSYTTDPKEMWVSILEKAFVKVCGGTYDFPGSTSSTDLYKLSGWLPDYLAFDDKVFDADTQWKRLSANHKAGTLLATLNTPSNLDKVVAEKLKLVPGHAYAILGFHAVAGGERLVKIKNPWSNNTSWDGPFSFRDTNFTAEMRLALGYTEEEASQGVFYMPWMDVLRYFSRCHLSWNPFHLFGSVKAPIRIARHGMFRYTETTSHKPQFHVMARNRLGKNTRLHFVLSRHILDLGEYNIKPLNRLVDEHSDDDENGSDTNKSPTTIGSERCPSIRTRQTMQGGSSEDDPADYVPLITLHIYETTEYPTIPALVATGQDPLLVPFDREADSSCSFNKPFFDIDDLSLKKTPLGTIIEEAQHGALAAAAASAPMTTSILGRRIHGSGEIPAHDDKGIPGGKNTNNSGGGAVVKGTLVHRGVYKNLVAQTISIDCPPLEAKTEAGEWAGCRHFTVVVSQLLPTTKGSDGGERRVSRYATLREFPFSLTLHTELPLLPTAAARGLLRRTSDPAQQAPPPPLPSSFINMCAIPLTLPNPPKGRFSGSSTPPPRPMSETGFGVSSSLPFGTRLSGHWIKGMSCGGTSSINTFVFNPQFHLSLKTPSHLIARVVAPNLQKAVQIHVLALQPSAASLVKQARTGEPSHVPKWYGRVGQVTSNEAWAVLQSPFYTHSAAVVDTSLGQCLAFDTSNTLVRQSFLQSSAPSQQSQPQASATTSAAPPPQIPVPQITLPIAMKVVGGGGDSDAQPIIYMPVVGYSHRQRQCSAKATCFIVPLLAAGMIATPLHTRMVFGGAAVDTAGDASFPAEMVVTKLDPPALVNLGRSFLKLTEAIEDPDNERSRPLLEAWCGLTETGAQSNIVLKMLGGVENAAQYQGPKVTVVLGTGSMEMNQEHVALWAALQRIAKAVMTAVGCFGNVADFFLLGPNTDAVNSASYQQVAEISLRRSLVSELRLGNERLRGAPPPAGAGIYAGNDKSPTELIAKRSKVMATLAEDAMQLLLKIDALPAGDARKALVAAVHAVQQFLDCLGGALADSLDTSGSVPFPLMATSSSAAASAHSTPTNVSGLPQPSSVAYTPPPPPLNRLPAGEYVIVLSVWEKGLPGAFDLVVETETAHEVTEIPPEGTTWEAPNPYVPPRVGPDAPSSGQQREILLVSGYPKLPSASVVCTTAVQGPDAAVPRLPTPDGLYSISAPLPKTHPLFDVNSASPGLINIVITVPSAVGAGMILGVRSLTSIVEPAGGGQDGRRQLPSICVARARMLLFREVATPSPGFTLIADSGPEASGTDCSLVVSTTKGAVQSKQGIPSGGSLCVFTATPELLCAGRNYRIVLLVSPSASLRSEGVTSLQTFVKCFANRQGVTMSVMTSQS